MKAYIYDELPGDQRLDHETAEVLSPADLAKIGVFYDQFLGDNVLDQINALAAQRSYKNRDEITVSPSAMGEVYESKVRMFFDEHLHEDEEIRFVLDGSGFFDVRAKDERWIRIRVEKGDLLILPAGIYHRFTTDQKDYIKAMRLFKEEPKWTPMNRAPELDENPHRKAYVQEIGA